MIFSPCCDIRQLISDWMTWIPLTHGGFNLVKIEDFFKRGQVFLLFHYLVFQRYMSYSFIWRRLILTWIFLCQTLLKLDQIMGENIFKRNQYDFIILLLSLIQIRYGPPLMIWTNLNHLYIHKKNWNETD